MVTGSNVVLYGPDGNTILQALGAISDVANQENGIPTPALVPKKRLFGGKRARTPVMDLETEEVYPSKAQCGKALGWLVGASSKDTFAWYKLIKAYPERFVEN